MPSVLELVVIGAVALCVMTVLLAVVFVQLIFHMAWVLQMAPPLRGKRVRRITLFNLFFWMTALAICFILVAFASFTISYSVSDTFSFVFSQIFNFALGAGFIFTVSVIPVTVIEIIYLVAFLINSSIKNKKPVWVDKLDSTFYIVQGFLSLFAFGLAAVLIIMGTVVGLYPSFKTYEINASANPTKTATIIHLSDLHLGTVRPEGWLQMVVDMVNEKIGDDDAAYVVITGDIMDDDIDAFEAAADPFADLVTTPLGRTIAIAGNHDAMDEEGEFRLILNKRGVKLLINEALETDHFFFAGVNTLQEMRGDINTPANITEALEALEALVAASSETLPGVYLVHQPQDFSEPTASNNVHLMLSGHTHAGQLWPLTWAINLMWECPSGQCDIDGTPVIVNQGTGSWGTVMRLGAYAEIGVITVNY
ncbi:Calcineurin-like phosphoesterase [Carpediemonas membranifera]|uniref:Calcineurin-like phosphoesterase n=1 Tax=Carpediemonas membranifera TaxID=201153 RepID=A0A8J6AP82_9EUKA|nr:Calcineurin-like phosphoesterase [Carpediemonas membranifera]|eukprot:KAG9389596.1 Calcineurin-like phosphoesterase [Carpediemonas membranifera]